MSSNTARKVDRVEWLGIGVFTLVGAILRFWNFGGLGLTHFDEGIYASSGIWSLAPDGLRSLDPGVISYAPAGFPILVGLAYSFLGVADSSAIFVSIVMGTLTIPLVGWLGKRLLGSGGGLAAAAFAALALVHIAFSRKALTDVSFLATWLLAIGLGSRFLERPNFIRAVAMGIAVGLAQNFKYNGWIAGVIVFLAAIFGVLQDPEERKAGRVARTFGYGLLGAVVAILLYLPWFGFVDRHGGYRALLAHQRSYMGGISSWFAHLLQQGDQSLVLSGGIFWGVLSTATSFLAVAYFVVRREQALIAVKPLSYGVLFPRVLFLAAFLASFSHLGITWVAVLVTYLVARPSWALGVTPRIFLAWWLVLHAMTPFYHPYARLWLPLHALDWLLMAALIAGTLRRPLSEGSTSGLHHFRLTDVALRGKFVIGAILLIAVSIQRDRMLGGTLRPGPISAFFQPTDSLRTAVSHVAPPGLEGKPLVPDGVSLKVLGRRPVVFYLGVLGQVPFRMLADRSQILTGPQPPHEWLLIDSVQFDREGNSEETWPLVLDRWRRVGSWATPLDPVSLLDEVPGAWKKPEVEVPRLWLFAPNP